MWTIPTKATTHQVSTTTTTRPSSVMPPRKKAIVSGAIGEPEPMRLQLEQKSGVEWGFKRAGEAAGREVDRPRSLHGSSRRRERTYAPRSVGGERLAAGYRHLEGLLGWINMVEVKVDRAAVVATREAASAGLCQQDRPDLAVAARHGLSHATLASGPTVLAGTVVAVFDETVTGAVAQHRLTVGERRPPFLGDESTRGGQSSVSWWHKRMFARPPDGKESRCPRRDSNPHLHG